MAVRFNDHALLWALGAIQPASPNEVLQFLKLVFPSIGTWPSSKYLHERFEQWAYSGTVSCINKRHNIFSMTLDGNGRMSVRLRRARDKARITLLRDVYDVTLESSGAEDQDLDGDSPSSESRYGTQEVSRPVRSGPEPSRLESTRLRARPYWPRVVEQLSYKVGLVPSASEFKPHYRYGSFPTLKSVKAAAGGDSTLKDLTLSELGICIGVSGRLLSSLTHKPSNHYRVFSIPKKGGGLRKISSPRFFLKTIQYWIKDYFLTHLRVHDACHSYRRGRSIITNAYMHTGRRFVANLDIQSFFDSTNAKAIERLLQANDFGPTLSHSISKIVTLNSALPQGAPTSPALSNALLFQLDDRVSDFCDKRNLVYTRYADDIKISGDDGDAIYKATNFFAKQLGDAGFKVRDSKTRVANSNASQRVTGLVVNEKVQPPREFRRNVRALFHAAQMEPTSFTERISELQGYLAYMKSFDSLNKSSQLRKYSKVLEKVKFQRNR